ncbi:MAG: alpha/beta hydrolase [Candidatus Melainabacteria bacterium]|nr:alpha/beta hydrolase [Candidatus Melainabacteria bacterium]
MLLSLQKFEPVQSIDHLPDLLFIHGTGSAADMWQGQVRFFTNHGYRCFVVDLRGHGFSAEPQEHTDLDVHISDLLETLESSDIKFPAAFVGHSLGAIISVTLAEQRPELFSVILAAGLPGRVLKPVSYIFKLFMLYLYDYIKRSNMHKGWAWRPRTLIDTNRHALEQILLNFETVDFIDRTPQLACTLHLAAGRFDPVAPCHYAVKIHKQVPNSTLKVFSLGGHNFMDTFPDSFNQWILDGLR